MKTQLEYSYTALTESIRAMMIDLAQKLEARHQTVSAQGITQADVDAMHRIMLALPEMD